MKIQGRRRTSGNPEAIGQAVGEALRDIGKRLPKGYVVDLTTARATVAFLSPTPEPLYAVVIQVEAEQMLREERRMPQTFRDLENHGIRREERWSTGWRPIGDG